MNDHPTHERLIAWIDEPDAIGAGAVEAHVAACDRCREEAERVREILDVLSAEPSIPGQAALDAQRERVMAELTDRSPAAGRVRRPTRWRRIWWAPALAAAALAGILLLGPELREPASRPDAGLADAGGTVSVDPSTVVAAEAERAADEVFAAVTGRRPEEAGTVAVDSSAVATLEALEESTAGPVADEADGYVELTEEFAELPADDRAAILRELETMSFDL